MHGVIYLPRQRYDTLHWVTDIVFCEMLGLPFEVTEGEQDKIVLCADERRLVMPSLFPDLGADRSDWADQIPETPLSEWDTALSLPEAGIETPLPVLFGLPGFAFLEHEAHCDVDILGSIFFMLSRFEEIVLPNRDSHDRFPAIASLAWKGGFLYRPIVDEYVELLWVMMKRLWPHLTRKRRQGRISVSCDVDYPFDPAGTSVKALVRSAGGDILVRHNLSLALKRARNFLMRHSADLRHDPYYTFDWYMDVCERNGHRAAFYFIADHSAGAIDGCYDIFEPRVVDLIRKIAGRGHEIGMHGSYNTFRDGSQMKNERQRLQEACWRAGLDAQLDGNRQHFLRWDTTVTPGQLDDAGFQYDTSGSFADRPGFRYGTSHPFPMWDWHRKGPLSLMQRPLVLMECSVLDERYLGMGYSEDALAMMLDLRRRALKYGGDFSLLWHNSHFLSIRDEELYQRILT